MIWNILIKSCIVNSIAYFHVNNFWKYCLLHKFKQLYVIFFFMCNITFKVHSGDRKSCVQNFLPQYWSQFYSKIYIIDVMQKKNLNMLKSIIVQIKLQYKTLNVLYAPSNLFGWETYRNWKLITLSHWSERNLEMERNLFLDKNSFAKFVTKCTFEINFMMNIFLVNYEMPMDCKHRFILLCNIYKR